MFFFKTFSQISLLFFSVQQLETGEMVAKTVAQLNMGFSAGLTLQMDLIVLRNSIFCHSACVRACLVPHQGRAAANAALINSTQGVKLSN